MKPFILCFSVFVLVTCMLIACDTAPTAPLAPQLVSPVPLTQFTKSSVDVSVSFGRDADDRMMLAARFSPTEPDLQLYDTAWPRDGVDGIGRPTHFGIASGRIADSGSLIADQELETKRYPGLDTAFSMYPAGTVELLMPIDFAEGSFTDETELIFTYMACSTNGICKLPVVNHPVTVTIPLAYLEPSNQ